MTISPVPSQDKLVNLQNYEKLLSAIFAGRRQLLGRKGTKTRGKI